MFMMATLCLEPVGRTEAPDQDHVELDFEFVETPPKSLQHECPICLHVLNDPHQITCCGYSFCKTCIHRVKDADKACPTCNGDVFEIFPNKGLQRSLNEFRVYCPNKKDGCEWAGELGELKRHLNRPPAEGKELDGCGFIWIKCAPCPLSFLRSMLKAHQDVYCRLRPFTCEHCTEFSSTFAEVTENHWPVCPSLTVPCPRECGASLERRNLQQHEEECPLALVECEFSVFGCAVKLPRKDMPEHTQASITQHMSMLAAGYAKQSEEYAKLSVEHANIKLELQQKDETIAEQKLLLSMSAFCVPVRVTITNFSKHRSQCLEWESPPFYTRPQGYKMILKVYPDCGQSKGVGVYIYHVEGEYDDMLRFPVSMAVKLRSILPNGLHGHSQTGVFTSLVKRTNSIGFGRLGSATFIEASDISRFVSNDSLVLEVSKVSLIV